MLLDIQANIIEDRNEVEFVATHYGNIYELQNSKEIQWQDIRVIEPSNNIQWMDINLMS